MTMAPSPSSDPDDDRLVRTGFTITRRQLRELQLLALRAAAREGRPVSASRCVRMIIDNALAREEERRRGA